MRPSYIKMCLISQTKHEEFKKVKNTFEFYRPKTNFVFKKVKMIFEFWRPKTKDVFNTQKRSLNLVAFEMLNLRRYQHIKITFKKKKNRSKRDKTCTYSNNPQNGY